MSDSSSFLASRPSAAAAVEDALRELAAATLHLRPAEIALDRPLTALGLDSLAAVELAHAIEASLGVAVPLDDLLSGATFAELLAAVHAGLAAAAESESVRDAAAAGRAADAEPFDRLTAGQRALWFLERLAPGGGAYHVVAAARLRGDLDEAALRRVFAALVARHEALRTVYSEIDGEPRARRLEAGALDFAVEAAAGSDDAAVAARLAAEAYRAFDLARGPVVRVRLLRRSGGASALLVALHHIAADFASLAIVLRELGALYTAERGGAAAALPPVPGFGVQARREAARLAGDGGSSGDGSSPTAARLWSYWRERLGGELPVLELPTDRPRPPVQTYRGGAVTLALGPAHLLALRRAGTTLFMEVLASFSALLARVSGQDDIVLGTPTSGRAGAADLAGTVGYFVDPVALRADLAGDPTAAAHRERTRRAVLAAFAHQGLPLPLLAERLQPVRDPARPPIFQAMLSLLAGERLGESGLAAFAVGQPIASAAPATPVRLGDLTLEPLALPERRSQVDLTLTIAELADGALAVFDYNADLFDRSTIARLAGQWQRLAAGLLDDGDRRLSALPLLAASERQQLAVEWNDTEPANEPEASLHELVLAQAARTPERISVVDAVASGPLGASPTYGESLTYGQLAARVESLAAQLQRLGVGPEVAVGLCVERGAGMVVAALGVLAAGGAYLPLDPALPDGRLAAILAEARPPWLLVGERLAARLAAVVDGLPGPPPALVVVETGAATLSTCAAVPRAVPPADRRAAPPASHLAYLLYTSGSTGTPKGVAVTHRSAVALVRWAGEVFPPADLAGVLAATSLGFDMSVFELFAPLAHGGRVIVAGSVLDLPRLPPELGVTLVDTVPSALAELLGDPAIDAAAVSGAGLPASVRTVNLGGEPIPGALAAAVHRAGGGRRLLNLYGPSEDTTFSTLAEIPPGAASVGIGRPIAATRLYLLAAGGGGVPGDLVPLGAVGEIHLGGAGVARGYLGRPELTAERFLPDSFAGAAGGRGDLTGGDRLYRTGDLARRRPDGTLELLGRRDRQVKVRGVRVELGEIEAALAAHPAVRTAAVLASGGRLVAYVAAGGDAGALQPEALRGFLRARLPEAMVPAGVVVLAELPRTASGKVDGGALAALGWTPAAAGGDVPRGAVAELLAGLWAEILGVDAVRLGAGDDFFALGGHSLAAARLLARVRRRFEVDLPLASLFAAPTLGGLAALVEAALEGDAAGAAPRSPLPPIAPSADAAPSSWPLTAPQRRLWFLAQLDPESAAYHLPAGIRLVGRLDVPALAAALGEIVRRHQALRTVIAGDGEEATASALPYAGFALPVASLAGLSAARCEAAALRLAEEEARRPFDLAGGGARRPLARFALLRLGAEEHVLLATFHHLIADGGSLAIFERELAALYGAFRARQPPPLAEPAVQLGDYARWHRRWSDGEAARDLPYWRRRLAGAPQELPLPFDHVDHAGAEARVAAGWRERTLSAAAAGSVAALARGAGATRFMVVAAAAAALLGRLCGVDDLLLGTPVEQRRAPELAGTFGLFVDTLVLRAELAGDLTGAELVGRLRREVLGALAHQGLPFERLVEELAADRAPGRERAPLVQAVLTLAPPPLAVALPGIALSLLPRRPLEAKFDLVLALTDDGEGLHAAVEYPARRFDRTTIDRLLAGLDRTLAGLTLAGRLGDLSPLSAAERQQLVHEWNDTDPRRARGNLAASFLAVARRTPEAAALAAGGERLSYRELAARAAALAGRLQRLGVGAESIVGLASERSVERIVGLLGIVLAGGAYLPLDPADPAERLALLVADAGARAVVTHGGLWRLALPGLAVVDLSAPGDGAVEEGSPALQLASPAGLDAANLACVVYTSGSTGRPKGVAVTHRGVLRLIEGADYVRLSPAERIAQVSTPIFDTATFEIWGALLSGACLVMPPPGILSVEALKRFVREERVSVLWLTAGLFRQVVESGLGELAGVRQLRQLLAGGDALSVPHVERALAELPGCRLIDGYGPTENSTFSCCHGMGGPAGVAERLEGSVPIGRPIAGSTAHVLASDLAAVPLGGIGELWLGGEGLARGYWGDAAKTAERFLPDPASGERGARLYRSGDRARQLADGRLEFLGRGDRQVKVRGFRVELEEVEAALALVPGVRAAVVEAPADGGGDRRLVAWVVGEEKPAALRAALLARLPEHAVPSLFVPVDELPLTPQGKVDRRALPPPERPAAAGRPPRGPQEELVAGIFCAVLGLDEVSAEDDFFALGGHSLLAMQAVSRLRSALGVEVSLAELFAAPTVADLAALAARPAAGESAGDPESVPPPIEPSPMTQGAGGEPITAPLSFAQERLWFLDQLQPGSPLYNIAGAVRLDGPLSAAALAAAFGEVVRRHEALRTRFTARGGEPRQEIDPPPAGVALPVVDLGALAVASAAAAVGRLAAASSLRPFDLAAGPLLRLTLLRLGGEVGGAQVLLLALHHIVGDGWSIDLLLDEVRALYPAILAGAPSPLAPLPIQYRDFARWQRGWLRGAVLARELAHWRVALAGAPEALELATDRPRPPLPSNRGGEVVRELPPALATALDRLGRRAGATRFMTLLAAFAALLARTAGTADVIVGSPVAGRGRLEVERLIGFFVNTLVLRAESAADTPADALDLLARWRRAALAAYGHQDVPFERLVDELRPARDLSRHPLFQVLISLEEPRAVVQTLGGALGGASEGTLGGVAMTPLDIAEPTAKFDLTLVVRRSGDGLRLVLDYARDLFDHTTVLRLARHLEALLAGLAADPTAAVAALPLLAPAEIHQLRREWNDSEVAWDLDRPVHAQVAARARARPAAIALEVGESEITYGELEARACRLARRLRALGVGDEGKVAVLLPRGADIIASILAIWKAGCVYLPLAAQPAARLAFLLADAAPAAIITRGGGALAGLDAPGTPVLDLAVPDLNGDLAADLEADGAGADPTPAAAGGSAAYMLYTSGSTGEPKAVLVEHRSLTNLLRSLDRDLGVGAADIMASWTTPTFDPSLLEWFLPLSAGARVRLLAEEEVLELPGSRPADPRRHAPRRRPRPLPAVRRFPRRARRGGHPRAGGGPAAGEERHRRGRVGLRAPPRRHLPRLSRRRRAQQLRADRGGGHRHPAPGAAPGDAARRRHRPPDRQHQGPARRRRRAAAADRRGGRDVDRRRRRGARLLPPRGAHRRALRHRRRDALVQDRRPGALPRRRQPRVPRPPRPAGEDPRRPHRARRGRGGAGPPSGGARGGGGRPPGGRRRAPPRRLRGAARRGRGGGAVGRRPPRRGRRPPPRRHGAGGLRPPRRLAARRQRQARPPGAAGAGGGAARADGGLRGTADGKRAADRGDLERDPGGGAGGDRRQLLRAGRQLAPRRAAAQPARGSSRPRRRRRRDLPPSDRGDARGTPRRRGRRGAPGRRGCRGGRVSRSRRQCRPRGGPPRGARPPPRGPRRSPRSPLGLRAERTRPPAGGERRRPARAEPLAAPVPRKSVHPPEAPMNEFEIADHPTAVAIVGIAARFPGAPTVEAFWSNLCAGIESVSFFDDAELLAAGVDPALVADPRYVKARGVLADADLFDAAFFNLTPREAELMDPQHRVLLECAWEALERAGYDSARTAARIAVFAGAGLNSYLLANLLPDPALRARGGELQAILLNNNDFLTTRISYTLDLRGPSALVQTACSTALVAVHLACQSLLGGECDMALAGGVSITVPQIAGYLYQDGGVMSPDGRCRAFDAAAGGAVEGGGAGLVVLKRLADALADGDAIHAVIRGSATNNDGAGRAGFTAPSVLGQAEVIGDSLQLAGVGAETIGYVEAHGSGTPLGDPIEVAALTQAFRAAGERAGSCALGSVKTNVGHLNSAAGVAGLVKAALAVEHGMLPPSLHFVRGNPEIDFAASPFFVNTELRRWETAPGVPRRAGVSSFGLGGSNAHAVLEEAPAAVAGDVSPRPRQLLLLAARTVPALAAAAERLAAHLAEHPEQPLADAAYTLAVGRRAFVHRAAIVAADAAEAQAILSAPARRAMSMATGLAPTAGGRPVAFLFPGLGDQHAGMARGLYDGEPAFRAELDRAAELLVPELGFDLREALFAAAGGPPAEPGPGSGADAGDLRRLLRRGDPGETAATGLLRRTAVAQPALFAVEYALARLLMSWGIRPQAMIGYSLGEYVAACLAGVLSLADALKLVARRARLIEALPAGAMLAVPLPEAALRELLAAPGGDGAPNLQIAAVDGPHLSVAGGTPAAVAALAERLGGRGIACLRLHAGHAFHTELLRPVHGELVRLVSEVALHAPEIPYLSNVTGTWITAEQATDPRYWADHMVGTVRFAEGLGELLAGPQRALVEVGPGGTLGTLARQHPAAAGQAVFAAMRHASEGRGDEETLLAAVGGLWIAGVSVDWAAFYAGERRRRVRLPTYPFERRRHWIEAPAAARAAESRRAGVPANRERIDDWFYLPVWRETPAAGIGQHAAEPERWLLFADEGGLGELVAARLRAAGHRVATAVVSTVDGERFAALGDDRFALVAAERDGYLRLFEALRAADRLPSRVLHLWSLDAPPGFAAAQERGLLSVLALVQSASEAAPAHELRLGVVASGLFAVADGERLAPERAPLAGLCRVIPQEYPHIACRLLDLAPPAAGGGERLAATLVAEMEDETAGEPAPIALRGRRRWLRGFAPIPLPAAPEDVSPLRAGGVYVVTDVAHGTGLALAEELRRALGARLAVARPASPPSRAGWAARVEALLAAPDVLALDVDVASEAGARAALACARERFGAVDGVFHTAAEFAGGLVQLKSRGSLPAVFGAPVQGALAWAKVAAKEPLGFLLLAASTAAVTGGFGQVDPCAAGGTLAAIAGAASSETAAPDAGRVVAVAWDPYQWDSWLAGGLAETPGLGGELAADVAGLGVDAGRSLEALRRLLAADVASLVVSAQDLPAVIAATDAFRAADLVAELDRSRAARATRAGSGEHYVAPADAVEEKLAALWEELFGIDRIGTDESFLALGGHSLLAIQMTTEIRHRLGVELPVTALFEHPTIAELARLVAGESGAEREEDLDALLAEVEALSAEEIASLLAAEREAERAEAGS